jgi:hypothetical protein
VGWLGVGRLLMEVLLFSAFGLLSISNSGVVIWVHGPCDFFSSLGGRVGFSVTSLILVAVL